MTNKQQLHEILAAALKCEESAMLYFDMMNAAIECKHEETEHYYWCNCQENEGKARGLLEAYKILTGRDVMAIPSYIRDELKMYELIPF